MYVLKYPNPKLEVICPNITFDIPENIRDIIFKAEKFAKKYNLFSINGSIIGENLNFTWIKSELDSIDVKGFEYNLYINPVIVDLLDEDLQYSIEFSELFEEKHPFQVVRYKNIRVSYQDMLGEYHEEDLTGNQSYCMQQEVDWLSGITLADRAIISDTLKPYNIPTIIEWQKSISNPNYIFKTFPTKIKITTEDKIKDEE